ncbi:hypothetical protein [Hymenobacter psoromatis]|uniref:hypothetical protein n=1 Tax=Hymenobacter psoromatis TaxID=1484116 RepID=UPI001CC0D43A|nr:hypothetical protein [Hymenobacter psoromatis]
MNPTPPAAPTNGVTILMAEIERIAQELRAYNKRDLPATKGQVEALVKLAERDRPLTLNVDSEEIVQLLLGQVDVQAKAFQDTGHELVNSLDERLKLLYQELDKRLAAVEAAEAKLSATAQRIPKQVAIDWLADWPVTAVVALGPLLIVLLMLWFTGMFSRVPKAEWQEAVQANENLSRQGVFYRDQGAAYRKKFPKSAPYFPDYVAPTTPVPAAE